MLRADGRLGCDYHGEIPNAPPAVIALVLEPLVRQGVLSATYVCKDDFQQALAEHAEYAVGMSQPSDLVTLCLRPVPPAPTPAFTSPKPTTE